MKNDKFWKYLLLALPLAILGGLAAAYFFKLAPVMVLGGIVGLALILIIFRQPIFGVFLITFFLPFERIGSFELGGMTIRASQVFALATILAWLATFLAKKKDFSAKNPTIIRTVHGVGYRYEG